ncbi:hypothetical protein [Tessaracoccus antarcticus]|uniref:DUF4352 domain-containing protein n=1 Tax=Tessaracoccus antarcticus TaxID=2479848 RepID=A0A3M0G9X1_9ACTN|nr:hypothetical protein [Tessaracoccus antarcticus]RMB61841.1 hypothetical protein EAX62_04340 [Tessaracoccus antarcticus]
MSRGRWGPWLGFACVVVACLVFSVGAGAWIVRTTEPTQLGSGVVGSWAELSDQGFRVRLDDVEMATAFPSSYDPTDDVMAPEGFQFLRVRLTVESLVPAEGVLGCLVQLRNRDGEQIGNKDYGIDGPAASDCNALAATNKAGGPIGEGDRFESQSVFIVVPEDLDSFTLDIVPLFVEDDVLWSFELG